MNKINHKCGLCNSKNIRGLYTFDYKKYRLKNPFSVLKCEDCGFVFNYHQAGQEYKDLYNSEYYVFDERLEEKYAGEAVEDYDIYLKLLEGKKKSLLEIGCAKGFLLKIAKDKGWDVTGVEISEYAAKDAKRRYGVDVFVGVIDDFDANGKKYDVIVALDIIEHVVDPLKFIGYIKKLLNKGGVAIVETPNYSSIFRKLTRKKWLGFNPYHISIFTPTSMKRLVEQCNMELVKMQTKNNRIFSNDGFRRLRFHERIVNFMDVGIVRRLVRYFSFPFDEILKKRLLGGQLCIYFKNKD